MLAGLSAGVLALSQLDNQATGKVYGVVSKALHIDLKSLHVDTVQISNAGHIVAGFVLCGLVQLIIRRWWVLPVVLLFFLGLEALQIFSTQRQACWLDVLRGWGGTLIAWFLIMTWRLLRMEK